MADYDPRLGKRIVAETRLVRAEAKVERAIHQALRVHQQKALASLNASTITAASPPPDPFDLVVWDSTVEQYVRPVVAEVATSFADHTLTFLRMPDDVRARVLGALDVASHITTFVDKVRTIGSKLAQRVVDEMSLGVGKGESITEISKRVTDSFGIGKNDATRIARTETHGIAERTTFESAKAVQDSGTELTKEWLSAHDLRVRISHREADGQVVPLHKPFIVAGIPIDYPGGEGPPDLVVNCRCTTIFDVAESKG